mgnify:CR=1 FL=1
MEKILALLVSMIVCASLSAQTMHTLIFVNTQENTVSHGDRTVDRTADYNNMKAFFSRIANAIGYTNNMRAHGLQSDFTSAMVDQEINRLNVGRNDIVVFYYSGHGANMRNDIWPTLDLRDKGYWQTDILRKLKEKCANAKLLLCIADCCNEVANGNIKGTFDAGEDLSGLKKLFTGFPGKKTITMSASKKGQLSRSDLKYGAWFGICLRDAIDKKTSGTSSPTWDEVLGYAKELTLKVSNNTQEPQYSIKVAADPFDD